MSRTLQTSTVYFSRVSSLFECNANDTYVLRMTHLDAHEEEGDQKDEQDDDADDE